jgi:hypothetical protein
MAMYKKVSNVEAGRNRRNSRVIGGNMEQIKPFRVLRKSKNSRIFYIYHKGHRETIV